MRTTKNVNGCMVTYEGTREFCDGDGVWHGKVLGIDDLVLYDADNEIDLMVEFDAALTSYIATCKEIDKVPNVPNKE